MAGHGSPPDPDRAAHPGRQVGRDSGMHSEAFDYGESLGAGRPIPTRITEYRPPLGSKQVTTERGTRFAYDIGAGTDMSGGQNARRGSVRTLQRARMATKTGAQRLASRRDLYSGKPY